VRVSVRRARDWLLLLPLLLAVAGCGPGVGGTGTGEGYALEYFGAKRASVCSASFAGSLKCPSTIVTGPAPVDPDEGSELVLWVDDPAAAQVVVRINVSDIDLNGLCGGVRFAGTWGETDDGIKRFFGNFTAPGLDAAEPGMLSVEALNDGALAYTLRDAEGNTVYGPVALLRAETEPTLVPCSSVSPTPLSGATYR
jgi:hypothetical protein